jgi:hypothetical protein
MRNGTLAIICWIAVSTMLGIGFGFTSLGLTTATATVSLGIGFITGVLVIWLQPKVIQLDSPNRPWVTSTIIALVFLIFAVRAFGQVLFFAGDQIRVLSPNNLGDICLHLTHINYLASGPHFWPENPIFAYDKLRYPIGLNLFNAELKLIGIDPIAGIIAVGLLGSLLTLRSLFVFNGPFGVAVFLFNGGLAGFQFFHSLQIKDYQADLAWKSIPLAMFVTQRGLLYAVPAGLILLHHWRNRLFDRRPVDGIPFWTECVLYATMPIFHLHTFLFLSFLLFWWFIFGDPNWRGHLLRLVLVSLLPATFGVYVVTGFAKTGALGLKPGWMTGEHEAPWWFWFHNFGFFLPAAAALFVYLCIPGKPIQRDQKQSIRNFFFPAVAVFMACSFIKFAPWEWDNTKLFFWAYVVMMYCLWEAFFSKAHLLLRVPALILLFFSGFISVVGGLRSYPDGFTIGSVAQWKGVEEATKPFSPEAIIAAYPTYNHPALVDGHRLVLGFPGHLWSHGLAYRPYLDQLNSLMLGNSDWEETARNLGVDYLFWGPMEEKNYPESTREWEDTCPVIAEGPWGKIYDLRGKTKESGARNQEPGVHFSRRSQNLRNAPPLSSARTRNVFGFEIV